MLGSEDPVVLPILAAIIIAGGELLGSEDYYLTQFDCAVIIAGGELLGSEDAELVEELEAQIIAGGELLALASLAFRQLKHRISSPASLPSGVSFSQCIARRLF